MSGFGYNVLGFGANASGGGPVLPSDDQFNRVSFLSHFDGTNNGVNNQFTDGSASNHTITANGNVTQGSFGPFARPDGEFAVHFDGEGFYHCAADADFAFGTGDFCMEAWVFVDADDYGYSRVFCFGPYFNDNDSNGLVVDHTDQSHKIRYYDYRNSFFLVSTTVTPKNTWFHVAVTKASNTVRLFINGTAEVSGTNSNAPEASGTNTVAIGNAPDAGSGGEDFQGFISNARVVKGSAVYTSNFTPSTSKLTAITNTKLLTCQSNRFVDNSAEAHAITIGGAAGAIQVSAFGPFLTSAVYDPAVNGASAFFDGTADYLTVASSSDFDFGTSDFCWECWVFQTSRSGFQLIMAQDDYSSGNSISCWLTNTGQASIYYVGGGTHFTTTATVPLNSWTHLAWVRKGTGTNEFSIYINGTAEVSGTMTTSFDQDGIIIGQQANGSYDFNGYVSNIRIANGSHIYTGNFTPPTAPLTAVTNTKLLLNMADAQVFDSAAQAEWTGTTVANGTPKLQTGEKKIGTSSLYFDGSSNYYFPNGFLPGGTGDFTIEFWFRASNTNNNATILTAGGIYFQFYNNQLWYFPYNGGAKITSSTISTDTWYHVAGVRSGTTFYFFLDGTSQGTLTSVTSAVSTGAGYFGMNGIYPYTGYIDEMRISKMARYTSNFTPVTEPFADKGQ